MFKTRKTFYMLLAGVFISLMILSGCAKSSTSVKDESRGEFSGNNAAAMPVPSIATEPSKAAGDSISGTDGSVPEIVPPADDHQKLIYTLTMSITADDPTASVDDLAAYVQGLNGYLSNSTMQSDDLGVYQAQATLRVPPDKLTELSDHIQSMGKLKDYSLSTDEITQQYWDINARLDNDKKQRDQLLLLLQQCQTVEDTLKVRDSLKPIEEEIETYEGQLRYMNDRVDYSTLSLTITRTPTLQDKDGGIAIWKLQDVLKRMGSAFTNTGRFLVNAFYAVLIALAYLAIPLVFLAVVAIVIVLIVKSVRRRKGKKSVQRG